MSTTPDCYYANCYDPGEYDKIPGPMCETHAWRYERRLYRLSVSPAVWDAYNHGENASEPITSDAPDAPGANV